MDAKNNQLSDIDVGKLNFHPMPKRFMVWDNVHKDWLIPYNNEKDDTEPYVFDVYELLCRLDLVKLSVKGELFTIIQSTNLFDKDGKEIFEGSIVMYNHNTYFVRQDRYNGMWLLKNIKTGDCSESINGWENGKDERLKLLGHILSNPELLQEDNV